MPKYPLILFYLFVIEIHLINKRYPSPRKKRVSDPRKEMQVLRHLFPVAHSSQHLLREAARVAKLGIIFKRPKYVRVDDRVSFTCKGNRTHYDVYDLSEPGLSEKLQIEYKISSLDVQKGTTLFDVHQHPSVMVQHGNGEDEHENDKDERGNDKDEHRNDYDDDCEDGDDEDPIENEDYEMDGNGEMEK